MLKIIKERSFTYFNE